MDRKICSSPSQRTRDADGQEKWYTKVPRKMNNVKKMIYPQDGLAGKMRVHPVHSAVVGWGITNPAQEKDAAWHAEILFS